MLPWSSSHPRRWQWRCNWTRWETLAPVNKKCTYVRVMSNKRERHSCNFKGCVPLALALILDSRMLHNELKPKAQQLLKKENKIIPTTPSECRAQIYFTSAASKHAAICIFSISIKPSSPHFKELFKVDIYLVIPLPTMRHRAFSLYKALPSSLQMDPLSPAENAAAKYSSLKLPVCSSTFFRFTIKPF